MMFLKLKAQKFKPVSRVLAHKKIYNSVLASFREDAIGCVGFRLFSQQLVKRRLKPASNQARE